MKKVLVTLWQCTWGFFQTFIGFVVFLCNYRSFHYRYKAAVVTEWPYRSSVSLGLFLFVGVEPDNMRLYNDVFLHEYGHFIQSMILGPLYLLVIGLPSFIWANSRSLRRYRRRNHVSYYAFYPEKWANRLTRIKL